MAMEAGADGVEFDVRLTKDGVPVVFHDADLKRVASRKDRISDLAWNDLRQVDVGAWFDPRPGKHQPYEFAGEPIPALADVLEQLKYFRGRIYIELKADDVNTGPLTAAVCRELDASPLLPLVIVKSFRLGVLPEVRRLLHGVKTAALFAPEIMDFVRKRKYIVSLAREFGADHISLHRSLASKKLCSLASDAKVPVTVWTCDNDKWIGRARERGIDAVITNDLEKMLAARNSLPSE